MADLKVPSILKAALFEKNVSQKDAAELIGISYYTFSRRMAGFGEFSVEEIAKICKAYEINPAIFFA